MERFTTEKLVLKFCDEGFTRAEAERIVSIFINNVKSAIVANQEVHLREIGKFVPTYRPPQKKNVFGRMTNLSERRGVKFRPFESLLNAINSK